MKTAVCQLRSESPYSQSKHYVVERKAKELHGNFEERTWRERCNTDSQGNIIIPPMAFANSLKEASKYLNISIPGGGKRTFTKHFEAGVMVVEGITLKDKKEDVEGEWLFVPSDGRRGGTTRVLKCFPKIKMWAGTVKYLIFDDIITPDVFEQVVKASGAFIGIGRFRPKNCGYYGRFVVEGIKWQEQ